MHNVKKRYIQIYLEITHDFFPIIEMHDTHDRIKARNGTNR